MTTKKGKFILDACCGVNMMWYNKNHPNTIYMDIREEERGFNKYRNKQEIRPDVIGDFRELPEQIKNKKFKLIAWDLPHMKTLGNTSHFRKIYGCLNSH